MKGLLQHYKDNVLMQFQQWSLFEVTGERWGKSEIFLK